MQKPTRETTIDQYGQNTPYVPVDAYRHFTDPNLPDTFGNMKTKSTTYNEGGNDERNCVLAYIRRRKKGYYDKSFPGIAEELGKIEQWLLGRAKRYNKAKGGLGKKG